MPVSARSSHWTDTALGGRVDVRLVTILLLVACTVALIAWDIYAQVTVPDSSATISRIVLGWVCQHPALPFTIGVVAGHLCWPQYIKEPQ